MRMNKKVQNLQSRCQKEKNKEIIKEKATGNAKMNKQEKLQISTDLSIPL